MSAPSPDEIELVRRTAALARIDVPERELTGLAGEFARILAAFRALQAVDVTGVEPLVRATELADVTRADRVRPSLAREHVLENAPEHTDEFFRVPKAVRGEP